MQSLSDYVKSDVGNAAVAGISAADNSLVTNEAVSISLYPRHAVTADVLSSPAVATFRKLEYLGVSHSVNACSVFQLATMYVDAGSASAVTVLPERFASRHLSPPHGHRSLQNFRSDGDSASTFIGVADDEEVVGNEEGREVEVVVVCTALPGVGFGLGGIVDGVISPSSSQWWPCASIF
jgi:hypothetical protein